MAGYERTRLKMKKFAWLLLPVMVAFCIGCKNEASVDLKAVEATAGHENVKFPAGDPQLNSVAVQPAESAQVPPLHLHGKVVWDDDVTVRIFSPFAGRVLKILVQPGQKVEKDQPLAFIASPEYGQAQADYRKAITDLAQAERNLSRLKQLADNGAAPQKELNAAESDYARAKLESERASSRLALYGGSTNAVDQIYCLRAPLEGFVVERNLNPGQEVRPDQMLANAPQLFAPLFLVTDPSRLWVQVDASEKELSSLQIGQEVEVHTSAYADKTFRGAVDLISDYLDPATHTLKLRARVANPDRALKAEMLVSVDLPQRSQAAVQVPSRAVFLKGEKYFVFVEQNPGEFARKEIKIGCQGNSGTVVLEGVQAGDKVVTDGSLFLDQFLALKGS
jgi:cobalt-zinc-cadmium efflux system membrane fusion protein